MHAGSTSDTPQWQRFVAVGLCPWWLGGRNEALHHSSCESGVATRGPDACVWTSPATVHAAEEYTRDPLCDINVVNVLVYPFAYRSRRRWRTINRRRGGIESGCLRGIRDENSFGDLRFSGRGELSCPFGLSTSQIFSDQSAALVRGGFKQAELDVLLLLPESDEIADLQTTLIAATNKKDCWRTLEAWPTA